MNEQRKFSGGGGCGGLKATETGVATATNKLLFSKCKLPCRKQKQARSGTRAHYSCLQNKNSHSRTYMLNITSVRKTFLFQALLHILRN